MPCSKAFQAIKQQLIVISLSNKSRHDFDLARQAKKEIMDLTTIHTEIILITIYLCHVRSCFIDDLPADPLGHFVAAGRPNIVLGHHMPASKALGQPS